MKNKKLVMTISSVLATVQLDVHKKLKKKKKKIRVGIIK